MSITNGYCTLEQVKERLNIQGADNGRDLSIELAVQGVSRLIDALCHRVFYSSAASTSRYFTPLNNSYLDIDDLRTVVSISSDDDGNLDYDNTWAATDYILSPLNDTVYTQVIVSPQGCYAFPILTKSTRIIGTWGYCATGSHPDMIREACILQVNRAWNRRSSPYGVAGTNEMGQALVISKLDPDVEQYLEPYRRRL
jgi:hypothetical protein